MNKILLLLILIASAGCVTQKRCLSRFPPDVSKDSIYIETIKETPVYLPGDTLKVDVPIDCPDQDIVSVENSKLKQLIRILNGRLVSNTEIKGDTVYIHTKETKTITKEVKVPQPIKVIPKFYSFCTFAFCGIVISFLGIGLFKLFLK